MKPVAPSLAALACLLIAAHPAVADDPPVPTSAPDWINAAYDETTQTVWLTWADVAEATSYQVYRNEQLVATLTEPGFLDGVLPLNTVAYKVTALVNGVESAPAVAVVTENAAVGNVLLAFSPSPFIHAEILGANWCIPIHLGGSDPPFFSIDQDCLDGVLSRP